MKKRDTRLSFITNQKGELVSKKDDRGRKTIYDTLPSKYAHYMSVGRL